MLAAGSRCGSSGVAFAPSSTVRRGTARQLVVAASRGWSSPKTSPLIFRVRGRGPYPIDQPRLKRTFEVILFFEVINNLKGVII